MSDPVRSHAAPVALTIRALQSGGAFAVALLLSALVLHVMGSDVANNAAVLGVVALIATPALSLAATVVESWTRERPTALLAVIVLGVLTVATGLALSIGR
jgi:hypothetical protein